MPETAIKADAKEHLTDATCSFEPTKMLFDESRCSLGDDSTDAKEHLADAKCSLAQHVQKIHDETPRYDDDPEFVSFRDAVWDLCAKNGETIKLKYLYSMWFRSKPVHGLSFPTHWRKIVNKNSNYALMNIAGYALVNPARVRIVMLAWINKHCPEQEAAYFATTFDPVWSQMEPHILKADADRKARKNSKKRKMRIEPNQTDIRTRITGILLGHTSLAVGELVTLLGCERKAVQNACSRMLKANELVRVSYGNYALPGNRPAPEPIPAPASIAPATPKPQPRPIVSEDRRPAPHRPKSEYNPAAYKPTPEEIETHNFWIEQGVAHTLGPSAPTMPDKRKMEDFVQEGPKRRLPDVVPAPVPNETAERESVPFRFSPLQKSYAEAAEAEQPIVDDYREQSGDT